MAENNSSSAGNPSSQKPSLSWSQPAQPAAGAKSAPATTAAPAAKPAASKAAASAETTSNAGMYVGIFVAGLIVGALVGWGISASRGGGSASTTASSTSMTESSSTNATSGVNLSGSTVGTTGNITIPSPQTAGFAVEASKISVSQPTWLVVYEDNSGAPGRALGAGLFFAGQTSGTIELLRATQAGTSYLVGQSVDDGDKVFSVKNDKPVQDSSGNPLFTEFKAQ